MVRGWGGNMDNYAVINGKLVELTDEQVKALGVETRNNPFDRVAKGETYSFVGSYGYAVSCNDDRLPCDNNSFACHNYFNDKDFANQVALHQLLYRKLLKFAYDNGCEDTAEWDGETEHWCIYYGCRSEQFNTTSHTCANHFAVYFSSDEAAEQAIKEVVEPFMKEHPDFVW